MIGRILGNRYEIISELGSGGMAWVYLAQDLREDTEVAVKVLYPQLSQDVGFVQRFTQEAKLAMSLSQSSAESHVARILDYGSDRDTHYLVMEYVRGHDLRTKIRERGPLPWREALDIARQVALALAHAHRHGIVHRDIKPENIMILPDGAVRVLDFGVARARSSPNLTRSGFVGSPSYAAPEQALGGSVDIRADLYSLGVVLYEMLSGELPFQSDTPWVVLKHHIATPPPLLQDVRPDLPGSVSHLVNKALSKRPEDRFQTPESMVQAIEAILSGLQLPDESPPANADALAPILAGFYQRATQAMADEDWQEAVDLLSQILKMDPRYRDVTDRLAEAGRQARLAALYSAARQAFSEGHWGEALGQLDEILQMAPDYRDADDLLTKAQQKYELDKLYKQGVKHMDAGEWSAAVRCLEQVQAQDTSYRRTGEFLVTARSEMETQREPRDPAATGSQPRRSRRRNWLWALIAVLLLALGAQSYLLLCANRTQPEAPGSATPVALTTSAALEIQRATLTVAPPTATSSPAQPSLTTAPTAPQLEATASLPSTFTITPVAVPTATSLPALTGQIAFPRFDPKRGTYDVYVCNVKGEPCRQVVAEASQPDFLPDGAQLVVHSWQPDDKGLILFSLSGQRIWRITEVLEAARPSVDATGKLYAFHSRQEPDRQPRLYRTYGAEIRPIQRQASTVLGLVPAWLPDGRILYSGCWQDDCGIIVMQNDGTRPRQVAAGSSETNPEASPDGRRVAFMSQRDGNWEVYAVRIDGSGLRRLTHDPANDGLPTWSPDGRHIAFVSDRDGSWAVWVMEPDGSEQRRLFALGGPLDGRVSTAAPHETHGWVEECISWGPLP